MNEQHVPAAAGRAKRDDPALGVRDPHAPVPLTFAQDVLWLLDRAEPGLSSYNHPTAWRIRGALDLPALERALRALIARHESLRTTFAPRAGGAVQVVRAEVDFAIRFAEIDGTRLDAERRLHAMLLARSAVPFDLTRDPLFRAHVIRLAPEDHALLVVQHHILTDYTSCGVLYEELSALYAAETSGRAAELTPPAIQFGDFAVWQRETLAGERLATAVEHWREALEGAPSIELPMRPNAGAPESAVGTVRVTLDDALTERIRAFARARDTTPYMTLLAALQVVLHGLTGQDDIVVGSPVAGRLRGKTDRTLGYFAQALPMRTRLDGNPTFGEVLKRVRRTVLSAVRHQHVPMEQLTEERARREGRTGPLFSVVMTWHGPAGALTIPGAVVSEIPVEETDAKFDLSLLATDAGATIALELTYRVALFDSGTAEAYLERLRGVLEQVMSGGEPRLSDLSILTREEHRALAEWNATDRSFDTKATLDALFRTQASRAPRAVATIDDARTLTYADVANIANTVTSRLVQAGVHPGDRVAIFSERRAEYSAAVLGVLQSGAAVVAIDPDFPADRIRLLLDDAAVRAIVVDDMALDRLPPTSLPRIAFGAGMNAAGADVMPRSDASSAAFIVYTSGSTGLPKGTVLTHPSLVNHALWLGGAMAIAPGDVMLQSAPFSFDAAIVEVLEPLLHGAAIRYARPGGHRDIPYLASILASGEVTVAEFVPAILSAVLDVDGFAPSPRLTRVLVGGERVTSDLLTRFRRVSDALFLNGYGPAEATIDSTFWTQRSGDPIPDPVPIGRPVANARVYLLDALGRRVPVGAAGEIHVAGSGVARGYLSRADLTAERFLDDPFHAGARMYRTGDRARYLPSGELEYLGRIDDQVKIRGVRIEPGEVEAVLRAHPSVHEAAVVAAAQTDGDARLVAYVVTRADREDLHAFVRDRLPPHMLPAAIVRIDSLPLSATGKVDRAALAAREVPTSVDIPFVEPHTATERELCAIWESVLVARPIGRTSNFFALGGHSLVAMRVIARIAERWGARFPMRVMFEAPTVAALAARIDAHAAERGSAPVAPMRRRGAHVAPMSESQELLWRLQTAIPDLVAYNVADLRRVDGELDLAALQAALDALVERHEILRTTFALRDNAPAQVIGVARRVPLEIIDLGDVAEQARDDAALERLRTHMRRPFALDSDLMLRVSVARVNDRRHYVLLLTHHIAVDAWSADVMMRELGALYVEARGGSRAALGALPVQFADVAAWMREQPVHDDLRYWRDHLDGAEPSIRLPVDRSPGSGQFEGERRWRLLSSPVLAGAERLARDRGASVYHVLLAAFAALLQRYSEQSEVIIGSVVLGRDRRELEPLIGYFSNTLPLRIPIAADAVFTELLGRVRAESLAAAEHGQVPYESIAREAAAAGGPTGPLFHVAFVLQPKGEAALRLGDAVATELDADVGTAKFDLLLSAREEAAGLRLFAETRRGLFAPEFVDRMLRHFETLLASAVASPNARLDALELMPPDERQQVVVDWNATTTGYPRESLIHELFSAGARAHPDSIAVEDAQGSLTYAELDRRSTALAARLRADGIVPSDRVAIVAHRCNELAVAMLATLKAGAAYVPLDSEWPAARRAFVMRDCSIRLVLDPASLPAPDGGCEPVGGDAGSLEAYVMYTSGSTGEPKGVRVPHRAVVRLVRNTNYVALSPETVTLALAPVAFDASTFEIWGALLNGGRVVMAPSGMADINDIGALVARTGVNTMWLTAALFDEIVEGGLGAYGSVRQLLAGGDVLSVASVKRALNGLPNCRIINGYGPTENTTFTCCYDVPRDWGDAPIPIGRPVANSRAYVLDAHGGPAPVGVPGELFAGGDGVALGYVGRDELTRERFVADPFSGDERARLYRTGDRVRWRPDGTIDFLGRIDEQVKIRGFRVEPGEVEVVLFRVPGVRTAAVVASAGTGRQKRLLAFYTSDAAQPISPERVRAQLRALLPEFMVPSVIMPMDELPTTSAGKIDRPALQRTTDTNVPHRRVRVPRTRAEQQVLKVWQQLLPGQSIGVDDDFFDLGGDSLLALRMLTELERSVGRRVSLAALFEGATIEELGRRIEQLIFDEAEPPAVVLQPEARDTPFVFLHGDVTGAGWYCRRLAPLIGANVPMIVLPTLRETPDATPLTIESMAAQQLETLRSIQPAGPYRLGGFCAGGLIALEMARQLEKDGDAVERLVMIDSENRNALLTPIARAIDGVTWADSAHERFEQRVSLLAQLSRVTRPISYYLRRLRAAARLRGSERWQWIVNAVRQRLPHARVDAAAPERRVQQIDAPPVASVVHAHDRAATAYLPGRYSGALELIYSVDPDKPDFSADEANSVADSWRGVTRNITVRHVRGTHLGMLDETIGDLAAQIRASLGPREHPGE